jgi:hypothetical protein
MKYVSKLETAQSIPPRATLADALRLRGIAWGGMNTDQGVKTILIDGAIDAENGTARVIWGRNLEPMAWGALLDAQFADLQDPLSDVSQESELTPEELDELALLIDRGASGEFEVSYPTKRPRRLQ